MTVARVEVETFNDLPPEAAAELVRSICASAAWQRVLVASRPFGSLAELAATSDGVINALGWPDAQEALAEEPGAEAVRGSAEAAAYIDRFGVPFVLDETGKTGEEISAALTHRLEQDEEAEQRTVRQELAALVRVRLAKAFV
jgi:2-oxo-4-hydroxy-4-carboxy-5-ureidoimidazoline decarboxylase